MIDVQGLCEGCNFGHLLLDQPTAAPVSEAQGSGGPGTEAGDHVG